MDTLEATKISVDKELPIANRLYEGAGVYYCHGYDEDLKKVFLDHIDVVFYGKLFNLLKYVNRPFRPFLFCVYTKECILQKSHTEGVAND